MPDINIAVNDETDFVNAIRHGGNIELANDIVSYSLLNIERDTNINLNNHDLTYTYANYQSACPVQIVGGTTKISGEGNVNSKHYFANVNNAGAKLAIYGGNFYSESASVIQVQKGICEIYGGTFRISDEIANEYGYKYTLNIVDANRLSAHIYVYGGSFYKFNPATDNPEVTVAKGYRVIQEGDWYRVVVE